MSALHSSSPYTTATEATPTPAYVPTAFAVVDAIHRFASIGLQHAERQIHIRRTSTRQRIATFRRGGETQQSVPFGSCGTGA